MSSVSAWERDAVAFAIAPLLLLGALAVGLRRKAPLLLLTSGTATGSAVALVSLHLADHIPYPVDRTGIYFVLLFL